MKFSGKMCLKTILKVTKKQDFTLLLEDTIFEKLQRGVKLTPPSRFRIKLIYSVFSRNFKITFLICIRNFFFQLLRKNLVNLRNSNLHDKIKFSLKHIATPKTCNFQYKMLI